MASSARPGCSDARVLALRHRRLPGSTRSSRSGCWCSSASPGLPNFGNGAFMAISAYTMAITIVKFELPMLVAAPLGIVAAVIFGLMLAIPTVRLRSGLSCHRNDRCRRDRPLSRPEPAGRDRRSGRNGQSSSVQALPPTTMPNGCACRTRLRGLLSGMVGLRVSSDLAMVAIVWPVALALLAATGTWSARPGGGRSAPYARTKSRGRRARQGRVPIQASGVLGRRGACRPRPACSSPGRSRPSRPTTSGRP